MSKSKSVLQNIMWAGAALSMAGWLGCAKEEFKAVDLGWPTDLPQAQAEAKSQHKLVLIDFSGSDWCPTCAELSRNILSTPEFKTYAQSNLALVDADFPIKTPQPEALSKANNDIKKKYSVEGFPTVLVLDGDGKLLDKMSDEIPTNTAQFIARLDKLKTQVK